MGLTSKSFGNLFEGLFYTLCNRVPGMAITRFPDGCRVLGQNKIVRIKTPFDWILTYGGHTALIDTKTCATDSFRHSHIMPHQVSEMLKHFNSGSIAGYVIWFREYDDVVFAPVSILTDLLNKPGSIKPYNVGLTHLGKSSGVFNPKNIFRIN